MAMQGNVSAAKRVTATFRHDPDYGPVCEMKTGPGAGDDTVIEKVSDAHAMAFPDEFARFARSRPVVGPIGIPIKKALGITDELVTLLALHGVVDCETLATKTDQQMALLMPGAPSFGVELRDRALLIAPKPAPPPSDDVATLRAQLAAAQHELSLAKAPPLPMAEVELAAPIDDRPAPASKQAAIEEIAALRAELAAERREKAEALALVDTLTTPPEMVVHEQEDVEGEAASEASGEGQNPRRGPGRPRKAA